MEGHEALNMIRELAERGIYVNMAEISIYLERHPTRTKKEQVMKHFLEKYKEKKDGTV